MGAARQQPDACVEDADSAAGREDGVEVRLGELWQVSCHPGKTQQNLFQALEVGRPAAVRSEEQGAQRGEVIRS